MTETAEQYARINEKYHARRAGNPRVPKVPLKLAHRATLVSHSEPDEMAGRTLTRNDLSVTRALENPELDAHTRTHSQDLGDKARVDDVPCQPQCRRDYSSRRLPGDVRTLKLGSRGDGIDLSNAPGFSRQRSAWPFDSYRPFPCVAFLPWVLGLQRCYLVVHKRLRWLNGLDQGVNDATDGVYVLVLTFAVKIQEGPATTCRGTGLLSPSRPRYPSLREVHYRALGDEDQRSSPARASGGGAPSLPAFPSEASFSPRTLRTPFHSLRQCRTIVETRLTHHVERHRDSVGFTNDETLTR
ncbi:hypothetical protein FA13DRAFT_1716764 [Coprinellus micaceus]|uniref:Uncharacterized protein n=1 Tax=Coprinellus micaceus TaxID=71717 RepID=A0A4Y7SJ26_COPMI|nr:hypothetical protein FA13DRAFT_1716764 [Coprinellus micaceus]